MKIATSLLACASVLAMVQAASAAPKVSGKYSLMMWESCEAAFTSGNLDSQKQVGLQSTSIGTITFPATAGSSGTMTVKTTRFEGGTLRIDGNGFTTKQGGDNFTASFTLTETTFTAVGNQTFAMIYGNVSGSSGVAHTLFLNAKEKVNNNTNCVVSMQLLKQ